jgi:hypothetical protein
MNQNSETAVAACLHSKIDLPRDQVWKHKHVCCVLVMAVGVGTPPPPNSHQLVDAVSRLAGVASASLRAVEQLMHALQIHLLALVFVISCVPG